MGTVICSDIDGVIAHTSDMIDKACKDKFGLPLIDDTKWHMYQRFGVEQETMNKFLDELFSQDDFWWEAKPDWENIDALRRIDPQNRLFLITGRHHHCRQVTIDWLEQVAMLPYDGLLTQTLHNKHKVLKYLGAQIMFEDRYDEAVNIAQADIKSYVIERSYNIHKKDTVVNNLYWTPNIEPVLKEHDLTYV